ncbi:MAG: hypothetical protein JXQ71_13810 [Verrucomicrobia bacterium]|nr:hypothetical protein [Verrucomicrobiota bacterium]
MRKKMVLAGLLALAAPAVWLGFTEYGSQGDYALGFGKQIAGGWLMVVDVGSPVEVLVSLSADGGVMMNSALRPAGPNNTGGWLDTRYNTTSHGSWKRTGPKTFEAVTLLFIQDNDGNLVMYEKVFMNAALNDEGTRFEGTGLIHLIQQGNDPLDPAAPVLVSIPVGSCTARAIR